MQVLAFSFSQFIENQTDLCELAFLHFQEIQPYLLDFSFTQNAYFSGSLTAFSFSQTQTNRREILAFSFSQNHELQHKFMFSGSSAIDFGDFDVRVFIGEQNVSCDLFDTMTIERGEDESAVCELTILPERERKNPQTINLLDWYQRPIVVYVVSARRTQIVFRGWIDRVGYTLLAGRIGIRGSDRREMRINSLPEKYVQAIGLTSKSAHGDVFETRKEELDARLSTTTQSFQFDLNGNPQLVDWQVKNATFAMLPCHIYQREPTLEMAEVGGVITKVEIELSFNYTRLMQRSAWLEYDTGLNVCDYASYGKIPVLQDVASAIGQTGWKLGDFSAQRVEQNGWYRCGGVLMGFLRDSHSIDKMKVDGSNKAADIQSITTSLNLSVKSGRFELIRRWKQNIQQVFRFAVHGANADVYGENVQKLAYSVQVALPESVVWEDENPHGNSVQYHYDKTRMWYSRAEKNAFALPKQYIWRTTQSGDAFADLADSDGEWERTRKVAFHTAERNLIQSNRNSLTLQTKFLPNVDLSHCHRIQHSHISGSAKVGHIRHEFDFGKKTAFSELKYRFFLGADTPNPYQQEERPNPPAQEIASRLRIGRVEIGANTEINEDQHIGIVYRKMTPRLFYLEKLVVKSPEIEAASTDSKTFEYLEQWQIKHYGGDLEIRL